jgi:hypothetical protein
MRIRLRQCRECVPCASPEGEHPPIAYLETAAEGETAITNAPRRPEPQPRAARTGGNDAGNGTSRSRFSSLANVPGRLKTMSSCSAS